MEKEFHTPKEYRSLESQKTTPLIQQNCPSSMPLELIESGFEELIEDKNFTYKRRNQFKEILEKAHWRKHRG
ncbi:MAG: hypothetical protein ACE5K4_10730 [Candidatus Hydrothermarchaeota archaeon]